MTPRGTIQAQPNPVPFPEQAWWAIPVGPTTLSWSSEGVESIEIRMDAPKGPLICNGGASGTHAPPPLLDRTVFYLLDASQGRPEAGNTLDTVSVRVVPGGKLPDAGRFAPRPWPWVASGSVAGGESAPNVSAGGQGGDDSFLFSIVIPSYQRRDLVVGAVRALARQALEAAFEVIVVVDGSTDGSASVLRELDCPFPLTVLEQTNQGAASARNRGAKVARGRILLFLDDDMEGDPRMLSQHDKSHREGADLVVGHIPLHPDSPSNLLSDNVAMWTEGRKAQLSHPGAKLTLHDLLTGQMSLKRKTFFAAGGFDTGFTRGGSFGNEDIDFGYRLLAAGRRAVFNPEAVSWQNYVIEPGAYLRQWRQVGRADVEFARKHPDQRNTIFALNGAGRWINRWVWRPIGAVFPLAAGMAACFRRVVVMWVPRGVRGSLLNWLIEQARSLEYWRGVHAAGGVPRRRTVRVAAYHVIADLSGMPVLEPYGMPPREFKKQLDLLTRAGFQFIDGDEFLRFLKGQGGVPRGALLLTFDDCYKDLAETAGPILKERSIPAVAFAVSRCVGGSNQWDAAAGAPVRPLADASELRKLEADGVEIGAHSRTHPSLPCLDRESLPGEIAGSAADLENLGEARPRMFAYPYGEYAETVIRVVGESGYEAAFTVEPGRVRSGQDAFVVPRIEILREDRGWRFLWKVLSAGGRHAVLTRLRERLRGRSKKGHPSPAAPAGQPAARS